MTKKHREKLELAINDMEDDVVLIEDCYERLEDLTDWAHGYFDSEFDPEEAKSLINNIVGDLEKLTRMLQCDLDELNNKL